MNDRESVFSILGQYQRQIEESFSAVFDERDDLRRKLALCNEENAHLRGELDEPFSCEIHPSHIMLPERPMFLDGPGEVVQMSCERCGFETYHNDKQMYFDDELSEICQGHTVMQP